MTDRLIALGTTVPGDDLLAALNKATGALQFHSNAVISTSYCYGRTIDERHDMLIECTTWPTRSSACGKSSKAGPPTKLQSVLEGQFFYFYCESTCLSSRLLRRPLHKPARRSSSRLVRLLACTQRRQALRKIQICC